VHHCSAEIAEEVIDQPILFSTPLLLKKVAALLKTCELEACMLVRY
jgi:hypothetical protein